MPSSVMRWRFRATRWWWRHTPNPVAPQVSTATRTTTARPTPARSVAASGDTVVVGAWGEDSSITPDDAYAQDSGAAYVFVRDGTNWTQQAMLKAPHLSISGVFGAAVAVSGDTVVITSYLEDSDAK